MSPVVPMASPGTKHGVRSARGGKSRCSRRPPPRSRPRLPEPALRPAEMCRRNGERPPLPTAFQKFLPQCPRTQCPNLGLGTGARGPAAAGWAITELPTLFCSEKSLIQEGCGSPAGAGLWVSRRLLHSHQSALIFLRDV